MSESGAGGEITSVAVIGAGTMGHGLAQVFAIHGCDVALADRTLDLAEGGKARMAVNLETVVAEGLLAAEEVDGVLARVHPTSEPTVAVADADFVLEAVFEDIELKRKTFSQLGPLARSDAILASNTSSFDINELAAVVDDASRVIGTHWFNPPPITPCVEVIPADATSQRTVDATVEFLRRMRKEPAVTKSVPGFVGNRIQLVMAAEAYRCLEEGVASAKAVDTIVRTSFGFRLADYGPLRIADLAGLDTYLGIYDYLREKYGDDRYEAPELVRQLVEQGRLGTKTLGGVYDYTEEDAARLRAERDRALYRRLRAYWAERDGDDEER